MADIVFVGQFIASKAGKTGLTVTVDVDRYTISDGSRTALVTGGSATEGRRGLYHYRLAAADLSSYQYVATFVTSDATVDQQEIAAIGLVVPDALVSSRLAPATAGRTLEIAATGEASANVTYSAGVALTERLAQLSDLPAAAPTAAQVRAEIDATSTMLASILEDTGTTLPAALAVIDANVDAVKAITDAIDTSAVTVTTSNNAGDLIIKKSVTFAATVSGLVIPADWLAIIWTAKAAKSSDDADAFIQARVSNPAEAEDGLLRIEGSLPTAASLTAADAELTVDQVGGSVALALSAAATNAVSERGGAVWDLKVLRPTAVADELTTGPVDVVYVVTHAQV